MSNKKMTRLADAVAFAKKAGAVLLKYYNHLPSVESKGVGGLVTVADKESNELLKKLILKKYPSDGMLSEELPEFFGKSGYTWIVDPLDGTTNYTRGLSSFSVSIGIAKGKEPVAGVVYNPVTKDLFTAEKGRGAFWNNKKIFVSKRPIEQAIAVIAANFSDPVQRKLGVQYFDQYSSTKLFRVRFAESAALDLCNIARGSLEYAYFPSAYAWDMAAGGLIVEEAGGEVFSATGGKWDPLGKGIIASNGIVKV